MGDKNEEYANFGNVILSGAGFLADSYDLFVINVAVDLMSLGSYQQPLTPYLLSLTKSIALIGSVIGQIGFGVLADIIGRKKIFVSTCTLVILGATMSATVQDVPGPFGIYSQLILWRFILGVGVGGEYPLSASVASENSNSTNRIRNLAAVFSMQGLGTILCSAVLVGVTQTLGNNYDTQWRLALGLGAAPMAIAFYFRWRMHETSWEKHSHNVTFMQHRPLNNSDEIRVETISKQENFESIYSPPPPTPGAAAGHCTQIWQGIPYIMDIIRLNKWKLLGTCGSWFLLDIIFYGNGLFSGQVVTAMGIVSNIQGEAIASLILQSIAYPGYIFTILFVTRIGLRRLQIVGFAMTALLFFLLAATGPLLTQYSALYGFLYGITFFFQNFGPNSTTYIIPSVSYSVLHKATCHGLSAAFGKLGAILGAQTFVYVKGAFCDGGACNASSSPADVERGVQLTFGICSLVAIIGLLWTIFLIDFDKNFILQASLMTPILNGQGSLSYKFSDSIQMKL